MADPLSVSASVAGLVGLALHGTRRLIDDVNNVRDAPKSLEDLLTELEFVGSSLKSLEAVDESQLRLLGENVYDQSAMAIKRCASACDGFRGDLQRWTKRSRDGKLSWRDKMNVGFFKEQRIAAMAKQLQSYKLTLSLVVDIATLYSTIRSAAATEAIKAMMTARQDEMTATIATVDTQIDLTEGSLAHMHQSREDQLSQQEEEDLESATGAIEEELALLRFSQEMMRNLIECMQEELAEHAIGASNASTRISFGINNSGFQVGTSSGPISGISFGSK